MRDIGGTISLRNLKIFADRLDPCVAADPGDISGWAREAPGEPLSYRIAHDSDYRNSIRCNLKGVCYPLGDGHDHLRVRLNHLSGKVWKLIEPALTRVALDDQIVPFDMPELSQLVEKRAEERMTSVGDLRDRSCAHDKCYSMRLRSYLSPSSEARDPAWHQLRRPKSARAARLLIRSPRRRGRGRSAGCIRLRVLAVLRLMTSLNLVSLLDRQVRQISALQDAIDERGRVKPKLVIVRTVRHQPPCRRIGLLADGRGSCFGG